MTIHLDQVADELLDKLPIFPLPNVVFFPGMLLPLQVFEQRYLELIEHCLAGSKTLAVPLLKPGFEEDYEGRPPIYEVFGAGVISGHRRQADGRMTVVLRGIERLRLCGELPPDQSFRLLRAERVLEKHRDLDLSEEMVVLSSLLNQLSTARPQASLILSQIEEVAEDTPELVDLLSAYVVGDVVLRQQLLEELDVSTRFARLAQIVADIVLQVSGDEILH
jgi:Lon protease-like protein